jgi:hypothetical protein
LAADAREKELMKDVPGWKEGSVYNSDRYRLCPKFELIKGKILIQIL